MKHMDITIKATVPMPAWWGRAVGALLALEQNPRALDGVGTVDMDAIHREARHDAA